MKKGKLMLLGMAVCTSSLFANAAFAAEHEKETTGSSFFTTFAPTQFNIDHSQDAVLPQHGWIVGPLEDQPASTAAATVEQTTSAVQHGWFFAPASAHDDRLE